MMRSKVRNTQMGLESCHGGWWPQPLMYVPYRWRAALCQLCPARAHEERLANSSAGLLLSRVPYAAWVASLKAFRLLNKCRTHLIISRFMIMKNKSRHMREAAGAWAAVPGGRRSERWAGRRELRRRPDKPHCAEALKLCPAGRCTVFILLHQVPGPWTKLWLALEVYHVRLNQGLRWVRGKEGKTGGGKNNNRRKTEDRLQLWKEGAVCMGTNNIFSYKKSNSRQLENMALRVSPGGR